MKLIVKKTLSLQGNIRPPSSKSQSIRAMLLALLAQGESTLLNVLDSEDTHAMLRVSQALGAAIQTHANTLTITNKGLPLTISATHINSGNSGITTTFSLPLLGLRENHTTPILFNCGDQMRARPLKPLLDALGDLGMNIQYLEQPDRLPIAVTGQLQGGEVVIDGMNSQYLSALLMSLPCAANDSVITVQHLHERPYINMTLDFLNQQHIHYTHQRNGHYDTFHIRGNQRYTPLQMRMTGDYSAAAALMAAAVLLPGTVTLQGLDQDNTQGDKRLISILQQMGADIEVTPDQIRINGHQPLTGITIDANDIPDLVPTLAIVATQAAGKTEICNVKQARIKETDRIHSMTEGLKQMGATIIEHPDGMTVYQSHLHGNEVKGYEDHRTVMALTVAGMIAQGSTTITNGEAINKTYPQFIEDLQQLGADIILDHSAAHQHIVLIGFKHVGKTLIGRQLAASLNKVFIDLDREIEKLYETNTHHASTCREIMQSHGETYYRTLETQALQQVLQLPACVISLGGGASLSPVNQAMIKSQLLLHVIAPRGIVFERIMVEGRPAFFDPNEDPYESFTRLWNERHHIYQQLTTRTVNNNHTVEQAVKEALSHLPQQQRCYDHA